MYSFPKFPKLAFVKWADWSMTVKSTQDHTVQNYLQKTQRGITSIKNQAIYNYTKYLLICAQLAFEFAHCHVQIDRGSKTF